MRGMDGEKRKKQRGPAEKARKWRRLQLHQSEMKCRDLSASQTMEVGGSPGDVTPCHPAAHQYGAGCDRGASARLPAPESQMIVGR
jgi:hypothetical protein